MYTENGLLPHPSPDRYPPMPLPAESGVNPRRSSEPVRLTRRAALKLGGQIAVAAVEGAAGIDAMTRHPYEKYLGHPHANVDVVLENPYSSIDFIVIDGTGTNNALNADAFAEAVGSIGSVLIVRHGNDGINRRDIARKIDLKGWRADRQATGADYHAQAHRRIVFVGFSEGCLESLLLTPLLNSMPNTTVLGSMLFSPPPGLDTLALSGRLGARGMNAVSTGTNNSGLLTRIMLESVHTVQEKEFPYNIIEAGKRAWPGNYPLSMLTINQQIDTLVNFPRIAPELAKQFEPDTWLEVFGGKDDPLVNNDAAYAALKEWFPDVKPPSLIKGGTHASIYEHTTKRAFATQISGRLIARDLFPVWDTQTNKQLIHPPLQTYFRTDSN